jgi:hypothetical protein
MPLHTYVPHWDVPQTNMGNKDSCDMDIELEGDSALDIHQMHMLSHIYK